MRNAETTDIQSMRLLDTNFMWKVFFVFAAMAAIALTISLAGRMAGRSIAMAGHTDDRSIAEVVIGNNVIAAPKNAIRFDEQRRNGVASRLDLYLRWPDLSGYSDAARDDFNHASGKPNILFLTFSERMTSRDMSGRYEPIYSRLTEPAGGEAGPAGLIPRRFTAQAGYSNEMLYVGERQGAEPFVARCLIADGEVSLAPCERDVQVGDGLSLAYRFPRALLAEWKKLDAAMAAVSKTLLKTGS